MKWFLISLLALSFTFKVQAKEQCTQKVYSPRILKTVENELPEILNQSENAYELGIELISYEAPMFCGGSLSQVEIQIQVQVRRWSEEGEQFQTSGSCQLTLDSHWDGENFSWLPIYIYCEDLQVEKDL